MQVLNAQCVRTALTPSGIGMEFVAEVQGQNVRAYITKELSPEIIGQILSVCDTDVWEGVSGSYFRLGVEQGEEDKIEFVKLGHIVADSWIDVKTETEEDTDKESDVEE